MSNPKTIKEIENEFDKFSETIQADFVSPGFFGNEQIKIFLSKSLLSLLDEVEKKAIEQSTGGADRYEVPYITMAKLLKLLSDMRGNK